MGSDVMCCFCGKWLDQAAAVQLLVLPAAERNESQTLYCHRKCLTEKLVTEIPRHPSLLEDDEESSAGDV